MEAGDVVSSSVDTKYSAVGHHLGETAYVIR